MMWEPITNGSRPRLALVHSRAQRRRVVRACSWAALALFLGAWLYGVGTGMLGGFGGFFGPILLGTWWAGRLSR